VRVATVTHGLWTHLVQGAAASLAHGVFVDIGSPPEVSDLNRGFLVDYQNVFGFNVAVYDILAVYLVEAFQTL